MHNQRISFVFLFSSRQRRISSFLKKKAYTHYQDPANSFISPPPSPSELCFPNFDDSLKFPSHLSCEALEKKVERPAGTSDDDDSNDSRGLVGATNRAAHSAHIIRKHKTHTDVLNGSLLFLFSFFFFFVFVLLHFCCIFLWFRVSGRRVPLVMAKVRSRSRGTHTSNSDTTTSPGNNQLRGRMKRRKRADELFKRFVDDRGWL
jgi:hypothetical protein